MAYTPISQTKKAGGYVPIGQEIKTTPTLTQVMDQALPTRKIIRDVSQTTVKQPKPTIGQIAREIVAPKRGFEDKETGEGFRTSSLKDRAIGLTKGVGEIGFGISQLSRMGLEKIPGYKKIFGEADEDFLKKIEDSLKPTTPGQAGTMRAVDIAGFVPATVGRISKLSKIDEIVNAGVAAKNPEAARFVLKDAGASEKFIDSLSLDKKVALAKTPDEVKQIFQNLPKEVLRQSVPLPKLPPPKTTTRPAIEIGSIRDSIIKRLEEPVPSSIPGAVTRANVLGTKELDQAIKTLLRDLKKTPQPNLTKLNEAVQLLRVSGRRYDDVTKDMLAFTEGVNPRPLQRAGAADIKSPKLDLTEVKVQPNVPDTTINPRLQTFREGRPNLQSGQIINPFQPKLVRQAESLPNGTIQPLPVATKQSTGELPALPKLPPEMAKRLSSKQADATINKAIRDRYSTAARRPVKEDSALAKAAKQPGNIEGIKKITGELLTPISSRLMRINPILKKAIREFEFRVANNTTKNSNEILPLLQATKKMSKDDQAIFDLARKNGDSEVIDALATKYDLHDELNRTRDVLNDIFERAKAVGMDVQYRKDYFPRMVTNPEKFMSYLRGTEDWGLIQRLLDNAATAKGLKVTDLTPEEQASLVNNLIRGYGDKVTLAKPGFTKARSIEVIDDNLNQFYESSDSALSAYIVRMNDEIEGRKFFGKHSKEPIGDAKIEDSIGSYVLDLAAQGKIKPDQIDEVMNIFKARFHRGKMNAAIDVFRNAEYISTMGSPISAITQIGDLAFSIFENGIYHTAKGMSTSLFSRNKLSKEALGIENITQEFTKNTMSGKALDKVFRLVGLEKMDRLGKETLVNGYLSKLKSQAKSGDDVLKRELDFMFDSEEATMAMKELAAGQLTDRTKLLAFNKLLDFQPVAKSEMPQKYLEMPNGRLFYMLKSFTLKQYDVFRREAIDDIVSGDAKKVAKGMKNLLLLSGAFVAANATADEIKDLILGRETPPSDKLVDNLWRLVGASKYDVYKARTDGVGQTVVKKILFPTSIADRFYKDVTNQLEGKEYQKGPLKGEAYKLESTQTIPVGGKLYYWWFGRGAQKEESKEVDSGLGTPELPELPKLPTLPALPKLPKI